MFSNVLSLSVSFQGTELVAMRDAPWYKEDWFGLKSLDAAKKIEFHSTPGNHLRFKKADAGGERGETCDQLGWGMTDRFFLGGAGV